MEPQPGDVVFVGRAASVQFSGASAIHFRVIRVDPATTYDGWLWLDGYELGPGRDAVERRQIFVQQAGLRLTEASPSGTRPRPTNAGPLRRPSRSTATGSRA